MDLYKDLMQQIADEENKYQSIIITGREFSMLKSVKNNIKKMQRQLYLLQKQEAGNLLSHA